jgi:hypothetical protein
MISRRYARLENAIGTITTGASLCIVRMPRTTSRRHAGMS